MAVELNQDGVWLTGDFYNGMTPNPRFAIKKDSVTNVIEATWMTDVNGDPIVVTQIGYGAMNTSSINALAAYDDVMALLL